MSIGLIIIFTLTALFGVYLISYVLFNKNTPKGIAIIHGTCGFLGILSLLIACFFYSTLIPALIIFVLAAIGGFILFIKDMVGKEIPKYFAVGHGLLAIIGFIVLIISLYYL